MQDDSSQPYGFWLGTQLGTSQLNSSQSDGIQLKGFQFDGSSIHSLHVALVNGMQDATATRPTLPGEGEGHAESASPILLGSAASLMCGSASLVLVYLCGSANGSHMASAHGSLVTLANSSHLDGTRLDGSAPLAHAWLSCHAYAWLLALYITACLWRKAHRTHLVAHGSLLGGL